MFNPFLYQDPRYVTDTTRISAKALVHRLLNELNEKYGDGKKVSLRITTEQQAEEIKRIINNEFYKWGTLHVPQHDVAMQVDYIGSNLRRGVVFYFICPDCERKVLHLYQPTDQSYLRYRSCHRLIYKKANDKNRQIRRLIKNPDLLMNYLNSMPKYNEVAQEALRTISSLKESGVLVQNR